MSRPNYQNKAIGTVAAVILLVVATSPFWTVVLVKRYAEQIINDSLYGLTSSSLAGVNITDGFVELTIALASSDKVIREQNIAQIDEVSRKTDDQLKSYEGTINNPQEEMHYHELVERRAVYRQTRTHVLDLLKQGKNTEAQELYQGTGLKEFVAYKDAIDQMVQQAAMETGQRGRTIIRLCNYLMILQGVLLVFFFIYAFFVPLVTFYERIVTRTDLVTDI